MSRERVAGQDFVIIQAFEASSLETPEELLAAETQRIVDDAWQLYLDVAEREPDADIVSLLEMNPNDDEDRDGMAGIVEEFVTETVEAWRSNEHSAPTPDKLALLAAFLGIKDALHMRGDVTLREYCLFRYDRYNADQSEIMLAVSLPAGQNASQSGETQGQRQDRTTRRVIQG